MRRPDSGSERSACRAGAQDLGWTFTASLLLVGIAVAAEPAVQASGAAPAVDESGTNPANFAQTLSVRAEEYSIGEGDYARKAMLLYSLPLSARSKLDFEVPFVVGTDLFGPELYGFGDLSVSWKTRLFLSHSSAVIAGVELTAPAASRDLLSANRWLLGPALTWAFFFPAQRLIFAPTYQHQFSISDSRSPVYVDPGGGSSGADGEPSSLPSQAGSDIHKGTFDLYLVYRFANGRSWLTLDPAISIDYQNRAHVRVSIAPAFGTFIGTGRSVTVQPVIPVTASEMDWGLKLSLKQVF